MAKILEITNNIVHIGDNGQLFEVRISDLNFVPRVGDEVEVYNSETTVKVILASQNGTPGLGTANQASTNGGININVQNTATATPAPTPTPVTTTYVQNGKVVNKVVYAILCFFLGGLGVHKFYAGKIGIGIVYLVFVWTWIPSVISFIEFIIALTKTADANGNIIV